MQKFEWTKSSACAGTATCAEVMDMGSVVWIRDSKTSAILRFTHEEWSAFVQGVRNGEFDIREGGN